MSRLLNIFRPSKRIIWQKLCEEIGADFIPGKGFKQSDAIRAYHENWTIYIDTYKQGKSPRFTRITAPYVNADSFHFKIFRRNAVSGIQKTFGMKDILVGHPQFDKDFIIQGNNEKKLQMMFDNELIRKLLSFQPQFSLEIKLDDSWVTDINQEGSSELYLKMPRVATDLQQLRDLYELFAEMLNHLCHIGSAYDTDPFLE